MCGVICRNVGNRRVGILQTSNAGSTATLLASLSVILKHRNIVLKKDLEFGPGSAGTIDKVTSMHCVSITYDRTDHVCCILMLGQCECDDDVC
jgi:hypothetical protein